MKKRLPDQATLPLRRKALAFSPAQRALSLPKDPTLTFKHLPQLLLLLGHLVQEELGVQVADLRGRKGAASAGLGPGGSGRGICCEELSPVSPPSLPGWAWPPKLPRCILLRAGSHLLTCPLGFSQTWCSRGREKG